MLLRLLESVLHQRAQRKSFFGDDSISGQKPHLVDEAGNAFDAIGESQIKRGAEFGVFIAVTQQLLMGRERDEGISDFVGQAIGHSFNQTQISRLDFEMLQKVYVSD